MDIQIDKKYDDFGEDDFGEDDFGEYWSHFECVDNYGYDCSWLQQIEINGKNYYRMAYNTKDCFTADDKLVDISEWFEGIMDNEEPIIKI